MLGCSRARTVVCVHGLGCSHRYFLPTASALARDARLIALDLPGFGRTPATGPALDVRGLSRALADWLTVTDRGGSVLLVNSNGCQVVVDLAVHSPELVGPVVLVAPTIDRFARSAPRQAWRLFKNVPRERPSLLPVLAVDYMRCGPRRYLQTLVHMLADRVERKLQNVKVPAVVLRGQLDPVVSERWAHEVAAGLPTGRLVQIAGAGHAPHWSMPEHVADAVRSLL